MAPFTPRTWSRTRPTSSDPSPAEPSRQSGSRVRRGRVRAELQLHRHRPPSFAFIVDIRRGNFDLQLLYKALFELSADRADFVSRLFSRKRPAGLASRLSRDGDLRGLREGRPESGAVRTQSRGVWAHLTTKHGFALSRGRQTRSRVRLRRVVQAGPRHPLRAYEWAVLAGAEDPAGFRPTPT